MKAYTKNSCIRETPNLSTDADRSTNTVRSIQGHSAVQCSAVQNSALHCTALHCNALHCTPLHCTVLHCTAMHCTALHCGLVCFFLYWCFYQHRSRDSVSPVCGIFYLFILIFFCPKAPWRRRRQRGGIKKEEA